MRKMTNFDPQLQEERPDDDSSSDPQESTQQPSNTGEQRIQSCVLRAPFDFALLGDPTHGVKLRVHFEKILSVNPSREEKDWNYDPGQLRHGSRSRRMNE